MVKLTILGRVRDGLPLAKGPWYTTEEIAAKPTGTTTIHLSSSYSYYKQQAEFILKEISRGALPSPKMTIRVDHQYSFHFLVANGVCFITLCESSYPRKLAFHYLQDLQMELEKFEGGILEKVMNPYSFVKFGNVIGSIQKRYVDTRTQANLSKLNANRRHEEKDPEIATETFSSILENRRQQEYLERVVAPQPVSPIWSSPFLEMIALRWTPITLIIAVVVVLLWASFTMTDYVVFS